MNYIHTEAPEVDNNNNSNYKWFKPQEAKQARPTFRPAYIKFPICALH